MIDLFDQPASEVSCAALRKELHLLLSSASILQQNNNNGQLGLYTLKF